MSLIPSFIRDFGISIVGEKCFVSLVENLDLKDVQCIRYSISKGLGLGIVVGGSVMKVPQVLLILNAGSAKGLSLSAYVLETMAYAITLAYSFRQGYPFSTYGENFFLTVQNVGITLLIIAYNSTANKSVRIASALVAASATLFSLSVVSTSTLAHLQLATIPLSLFSKLPQIAQNYSAKSTGQVSVVAVVAQIAGCMARLFTTSTEIGDSIVAAGFALALVLNLVLGAQMWMYWGQTVEPRVAEKLKEKQRLVEVQPVQRPESPAQRVATPPPGNRKWARKVD
ncbi:hypothetical protein C8J56DRAFT_927132 [Mycena floridula]|nr:hypothetical protein C8J56DRAFT_927132 [Mycena floridula]